MKTIVENSSKLSKYIFPDDVVVIVDFDSITVGDPARFIIADLNNKTATVFENVTAPKDWIGNKYLFDGTTWTLNPDYKEPTQPE